jgi:hypothetical protein
MREYQPALDTPQPRANAGGRVQLSVNECLQISVESRRSALAAEAAGPVGSHPVRRGLYAHKLLHTNAAMSA